MHCRHVDKTTPTRSTVRFVGKTAGHNLLSVPVSRGVKSGRIKMSEAALYIFALFDGAALLFLSVFFVSFTLYSLVFRNVIQPTRKRSGSSSLLKFRILLRKIWSQIFAAEHSGETLSLISTALLAINRVRGSIQMGCFDAPIVSWF